MTDLRQAAQQALEALTIYSDAQCSLKGQAAIAALRTALEQQAEPTCPDCKAAVLYECVACSSNNYPPQQQAEPISTNKAMRDARLNAGWGSEQQAETPPEWPLIKNILAEYGLDAIAFVAEFKAAQRPWVGLTDNDWGWVADRKGTSLDTFEQGATWAAYKLERRNT